MATGRDQDVFRAIKAALEATGAFEAVLLHQDPDRPRVANDRSPIATVRRTSANEVDLCGFPITRERAVDYELTIAVRGMDPEARFEALDLLRDLAADALDGRSLASLTLPSRTTLAGSIDDLKAGPPEHRVTMKGRFAYLIDEDDGPSIG